MPDKEAVASIVNEMVSDFATKGHRSLGVAVTDAQGKWRYAGLIEFMMHLVKILLT